MASSDMAEHRMRPGVGDLDERDREVLRRVVHEYVRRGKPVSSSAVARLREEGLSPATIRGIFGRLERTGYLHQPHTSAGRVPTEHAYRLYVDTVLETARVRPRDRDGVVAGLAVRDGIGDAEAILNEASRVLSRLSSHVGVVVAPPLGRTALRRIGFVHAGGDRIVVVLVDASGVVHHRLIRVREALGQRDLERAGRYLESEFAGMTLAQIHSALRVRMAEERAAYDRLVRQALTLASLAVQGEGEAAVFLEGTANLAGFEARAVRRMEELLRALHEKESIVRLLEPCLRTDGVCAVIGSETGEPELEDLAVLATSYRVGGRPIGSIGIIGPTRMDYDRLVGLVAYTGQRLGQVLTEAIW